jgi:hypothetical protein
MIRVVHRALMIALLSNICAYQSSVKPPHCVLDLERLKERTIIVRIGAYRKISISTI